jgi:phosphate-selective porin
MSDKKINRVFAAAFASALYASWGQADDAATIEDKGGPSIETADGNFTFSVFGCIQTDAALYDEGGAALGSGTSFCRARIGVQGTFCQDCGFQREVGFAGEELPLADVLLQCLGFDPIIITAGTASLHSR